MAVLQNGYVDDAVVYAYARARFPNNFSGAAITDSFRAAVTIAGDIVNGNDSAFLGEKAPQLSDDPGKKVWPRVAGDSSSAVNFLDGSTIPQDLKCGYEWLAIMVALFPEQFGTTNDSSTEVVTNAGGVSGVGYDGVRVDYVQQSTDTRKRNASSVVPITFQFAYGEAIRFMRPLLRAGATFSVSGVDQELPTTAGQQVYAFMSGINVARA